MLPEIVAGLLAVFGVLVGALGWMKSKKDTAEQKAQVAEQNLAVERSTRAKESEIDQAKAQARTQSAEVQKDHEDRPTDVRPDGDFRR